MTVREQKKTSSKSFNNILEGIIDAFSDSWQDYLAWDIKQRLPVTIGVALVGILLIVMGMISQLPDGISARVTFDDSSGLLGEPFLSLENTSSLTMTEVRLVMNGKYEATINEVHSGESSAILFSEFSGITDEDSNPGASPTDNIKPRLLRLYSNEGELSLEIEP